MKHLTAAALENSTSRVFTASEKQTDSGSELREVVLTTSACYWLIGCLH